MGGGGGGKNKSVEKFIYFSNSNQIVKLVY